MYSQHRGALTVPRPQFDLFISKPLLFCFNTSIYQQPWSDRNTISIVYMSRTCGRIDNKVDLDFKGINAAILPEMWVLHYGLEFIHKTSNNWKLRGSLCWPHKKRNLSIFPRPREENMPHILHLSCLFKHIFQLRFIFDLLSHSGFYFPSLEQRIFFTTI